MALTSKLIHYDPSWAKRYDEEAAHLTRLFSDHLVSIHHVGSTSIPNIMAKPEIDILVVLDGVDHMEQYAEGMVTLGYDVRGEAPVKGWFYYSKNVNGRRTHKVHVCSVGHKTVWEKLMFKDYMRRNPTRAEEYGKLKVALEAANKGGMAEYLEAKAPFIQETLHLAIEEGYEKLEK